MGMRLVHLALFPLLLAALLACGCMRGDKTTPAATAIEQMVSGKPLPHVDSAVWKDVRAFYQQRNGKTTWVDGNFSSKRAAAALQVLRSAREHGLSPENYGEREIVEMHDAIEKSDKNAPDRAQRLAEFDVKLTAALLTLGHDVALGRVQDNGDEGRPKTRRAAPDFAGTLATAVDGDIETWLNEVCPKHPEYAALQKAYVALGGQKEKGGWPTVPAGVYKIGKSHPSVVILRQRLLAGGQLAGDAATNNSPLFNKSLSEAVGAFQELHGIKATGALDTATLAAMNVSIEQRLAQVALNMDRWRAMPDDLGARHFLVNIPSFHLFARENGKTVMDIRVVVGKRGNETPIFSDEMETVVFSPYWNIPDSIKQGETAPAVARDPAYLERNNIEVLRGSKPVDVASINWDDPAELRQLAFRQRPGGNNALGHVKFLFPNDYDVYLHDTPADSLFQRSGRAFSHGCVRVEEPEKLANYILRDQPEWDGPKIMNAMDSGDEEHVKLKETIPVHIVYFTAWVDEKGGLHFQPDIYGYDAKQQRLDNAASRAKSPKAE
jgi:L,D-transpeptidase YcbB